MGLGTTVVLGLTAAGTILVGMPVGRLRRPGAGLTVLLNSTAIGVLLFLLWDVLSAGWAPTDGALVATHTESASFAPVAGYGLLFLAGIAAGLLTLVGYER